MYDDTLYPIEVKMKINSSIKKYRLSRGMSQCCFGVCAIFSGQMSEVGGWSIQ